MLLWLNAEASCVRDAPLQFNMHAVVRFAMHITKFFSLAGNSTSEYLELDLPRYMHKPELHYS